MNIKLQPRFFAILAALILLGMGTFFYIRQERGVTFKTFEKGKIIPVTGKDSAIKNLKDQFKNKFVIVFFYDGYSDQNQALNAIQVLKAATVLVEPFKSFEKDIVFKSFTTDSSKCRVKEENTKKLLVCEAKLIDSFKSLGIDHFKLVILSPLEFSSTVLPARGSNSWMTLSTSQGNLSTPDYKRFLGLTFMQSLGRSLGLATEDDPFDSPSTDSTISGSLRASAATLVLSRKPNCALDEAQAKDWWGGETSANSAQVGYFKGCLGNPSYIYPEQDTLMSGHPKKESYGKISEDYLREILHCFYSGETSTSSASLSSCSLFKQEYPNFWKE